MADSIRMAVVVAAVWLSVGCINFKWVDAQVHHVVGGDQGWDATSDVASWAEGRIFRVGDNLWFAYSAARERIVELRSMEEYKSCDVSNPIRMYTDGIDSVTLEKEGIRYFASGDESSCKSGLKLHVDVQPQGGQPQMQKLPLSKETRLVLADGPVSPSRSCPIRGPPLYLIFAGLVCLVSLLAM